MLHVLFEKGADPAVNSRGGDLIIISIFYINNVLQANIFQYIEQ